MTGSAKIVFASVGKSSAAPASPRRRTRRRGALPSWGRSASRTKNQGRFGTDGVSDLLPQDTVDIGLRSGIERPAEYLVNRAQLAGMAGAPQCRRSALIEKL